MQAVQRKFISIFIRGCAREFLAKSRDTRLRIMVTVLSCHGGSTLEKAPSVPITRVARTTCWAPCSSSIVHHASFKLTFVHFYLKYNVTSWCSLQASSKMAAIRVHDTDRRISLSCPYGCNDSGIPCKWTHWAYIRTAFSVTHWATPTCCEAESSCVDHAKLIEHGWLELKDESLRVSPPLGWRENYTPCLASRGASRQPHGPASIIQREPSETSQFRNQS